MTDKDLVQGLNEYWEEGRVLTEEEKSEKLDEYHDRDSAEQAIDEDPLEISVRDNAWHSLDDTSFDPDEYRILLTTGGPAVQVKGELRSKQPRNAQLQCQDWFTPWTDVEISSEEDDYLLAYAQHFYFGD